MNVILSILAFAILTIVILALRKPDYFRYEWKMRIKTPPERIFPFLNDFRKAREWSPWEEIDPGMSRELTGPDVGKGAKYTWSGNNKIGAGNMEIIDSLENRKVVCRLEFIRPMKAVSTVEYLLENDGDETEIAMAMHGPNNFTGKLVSLFIDCEKYCREQNLKGLAKLKKIVEV